MRQRAPLTIFLAMSTLAGCTDLTPIQNDLKDLHIQVNRLSAEQETLKTTSNNAVQSAKRASDAAHAAASKADQALALAQTDQRSIDATNKKIDRMFRRRLSK
jgi:uncharacterized protein YPO0396